MKTEQQIQDKFNEIIELADKENAKAQDMITKAYSEKDVPKLLSLKRQLRKSFAQQDKYNGMLQMLNWMRFGK